MKTQITICHEGSFAIGERQMVIQWEILKIEDSKLNRS
jgi:hypothetical protein